MTLLMSKIGHAEIYDNAWKSIVANRGSVQHLDFVLDEWEKDVFKTAVEINQAWIIEHAAVQTGVYLSVSKS